MKQYKIEIIEKCKGIIEVEAESYREARELAEEKYFDDPNAFVLEPYDTDFV